jgi:hypothetical protein
MKIWKDKYRSMHIINQYNFAQLTQEFIFTINTALGTGASITLPLPSGQTYNFTVDYGDGSPLKTVTAYNDPNASYTYAMDGIYQIKINGKCGGWSFNNGGDKLKITSVDQWGEVDFDYLAGAFWGCVNLSSICSGTISGTSSVTAINSFFQSCPIIDYDPDIFSLLTGLRNPANCFAFTNISTFYANTLKNNVLINNISQLCYSCPNLTTIEVDSFRYNTQITTVVNCFFNCTALTGLPEDLFYYNILVSIYANAFRFCRNMSLPTRLFNLSALNIVTNMSRFMETSNTAYSNLGTIQDIWNYATSATSVNAFLNQTSISNYVDIPFDWKGMVEVGTLTTDQSTLQQVGINRTFTGIAEINWGDGNFTRCTSAVEALHDYSSTGTYDIKLGAASNTATTTFRCDNARITDIVGLKTGQLTSTIIITNSLTGVVSFAEAPMTASFQCQNNISMTGIDFAPSGNGTLTFMRCYTTGVVELDFSNINLSGNIQIYSNTSLEDITFALTGNGVISNCLMYDNDNAAFTDLDFSNQPLGGTVSFNDCTYLTNLTLSNTSNSALTSFSARSCNLPNIDFSVFPTSDGVTINLQDNAMTSTEVDNQLINLDATGWINGTLNIAGTNAARTSASDTAYNNLIANGWTITVN